MSTQSRVAALFRQSSEQPLVVSVYLPRETYNELVRVATARQVSLSALMREQLVKAFPPTDANDRSDS